MRQSPERQSELGIEGISDDDLFKAVVAVGAGVEVRQDESLPPEVREAGRNAAEEAAAKLADLNRGAAGDDSSADDHL